MKIDSKIILIFYSCYNRQKEAKVKESLLSLSSITKELA